MITGAADTGLILARPVRQLEAASFDQRLDEPVDVVPLGLDVGLEPVLAERRARDRSDADQSRARQHGAVDRRRAGIVTVEDEVKVT